MGRAQSWYRCNRILDTRTFACRIRRSGREHPSDSCESDISHSADVRSAKAELAVLKPWCASMRSLIRKKISGPKIRPENVWRLSDAGLSFGGIFFAKDGTNCKTRGGSADQALAKSGVVLARFPGLCPSGQSHSRGRYGACHPAKRKRPWGAGVFVVNLGVVGVV